MKMIAIIAIAVMCAALVYGFSSGDLSREGSVLVSLPWGIVTLIDFYVGIFIFSAWVWFREQAILAGSVWTLAFILLGNLATAIYLLKAAIESKGNIQYLMFGFKKRVA